jgi:hypothetical protein
MVLIEKRPLTESNNGGYQLGRIRSVLHQSSDVRGVRGHVAFARLAGFPHRDLHTAASWDAIV